MANYVGYTRTNYFRVNDEQKFVSILSKCYTCEGEELEEMAINTDEGRKVGFYCEDSLLGYAENPEDTDYNLDAFYQDLQSLLPDDDAILITEVGKEKMRYLVGRITVLTKNNIQCKSLDSLGKEMARKTLGEKWATINKC